MSTFYNADRWQHAFPSRVTRVADAKAIASGFIPTAKNLARLYAAEKYPLIRAEMHIETIIREVVAWLQDKQLKLYKNPRRQLAPILAARFTETMHDLATMRAGEIYKEQIDYYWNARSEHFYGPFLNGDGAGI